MRTLEKETRDNLPARKNNDDDRRWELLLLLLALLMSFCCVFCSTGVVLQELWPEQLSASLLATRQADYFLTPLDSVKYAPIDDPFIGAQAATDVARLRTTPVGPGGPDAITSIGLLPATPTPAATSGELPLPPFQPDTTQPSPTAEAPSVTPEATVSGTPAGSPTAAPASPTPATAVPSVTPAGSPTAPAASPTVQATSSPLATVTPVPPVPTNPPSTAIPTTQPPPPPPPADDDDDDDDSSPPPAVAPVRPILERVQDNGNCTTTAFWGYQNDNPFVVTIPIGANNTFNPGPSAQGQPTAFNPGRVASAFSTVFNTTLGWTLAGTTVSAAQISTCQITGRVFEDVDYSGGPGTGFVAGTDLGLPNVQVELYNGLGTLLGTTTTDAAGNYSLSGANGASNTIRVVSSSIGDADTPPSGGYNITFTSALAEQTYEHNGLSGNGGTGAMGGNNPAVGDPATPAGAGAGDTNVTVTLSGADLSGVDLGFAFNPVVNINDSGQGSLRQAMLNANAITDTDSVVFNIPGAGPHTIQPASALPIVADPLKLDGTTQPGFAGKPLIELDGTNAGAGVNGIFITAGESLVQGLVINRFENGIGLAGGNQNTIQNNYIGTDANGIGLLPNNQYGLLIVDSSINQIGGGGPEASNLIAGNGASGIALFGASQSVSIRRNNIFANGGLGIDLGNNGVTANDAGDGDGGENELLNFPLIYSWVISGTDIIITGEARPASTIEFFRADSDPSGNGEGQIFIGSGIEGNLADDAISAPGLIDPTADQFSFTLTPISALTGTDLLTATATDVNGNTSEFSLNVAP
jgi:hypothetical protein